MRLRKDKLIFASVFSVVAFILVDVYTACLSTYPAPILAHISEAVYALPAFIAQRGAVFCFEPAALAAGLVAACGIWIVWAYSLMREGNYRNGEEHGSAHWGTIKEGQRFRDKEASDNNIIFTEHYAMAVSRKQFDLELDRNRNVLVIGGSGSGKSRYYVLPNLMQANTSFFVTDPKGTMLPDVGHMLEREKYRILSFNTIDFTKSMHYNPIAYVHTQADVYTFVDCLIKNTTPEGESSNDPFWEKSERMLYMALIGYLVFHCPEKDRNIPGLMTLLNLAEAHEDDESYMSPLDLLFHEIESGQSYQKVSDKAFSFDADVRGFANGTDTGYAWVKTGTPTKPENDFSLNNYTSFKSGAAKTLKSIIISCNARLAPFTFDEMREVLRYDEMHLDTLGDPGQKTALFAIMKDTSDSFAFLFAIMMWQTMNVLCDKALAEFGGQLPTPVHFIFDEFANLGHLPEVQKTVAVVRSRNMSLSIILQSIAQLKREYKDDAQTIIDCCDTTLFLGSKSNETNKEISEMIGKETVSTLNVNESRGANPSTTKNYGRSERDLIQAAEIGKLKRSQAILLIAGTNPLLDGKYRPETHSRYKYVDRHGEDAVFREKFDFEDYCARVRGSVMPMH